jgi:hypothetical protein
MRTEERCLRRIGVQAKSCGGNKLRLDGRSRLVRMIWHVALEGDNSSFLYYSI